MSNPVVSSRTPIGQIINRDGTATFAFLKWMQNIGSTINVTFDSEGVYQGAIGDQATIDGRETLASIVQNISNDGVVQGPGIDFALPYLNKNTDHIADGTGSPLAGGKAAYIALVASSPVAGQTIRFNGTDWLPVAIAITKAGVASQWLRSYDAATGTFSASQPAFTDISGVATKAQLPAAIAYEDEANIFTANQAITGNLSVSGSVNAGGNPVQAQLTLTTTGSSGPSTLIGATLNIPQYSGGSGMVYPAAGVPVSTGAAWGTSIATANIALLNAANTFTANQAINGALSVATGKLRLVDRGVGPNTGSPNVSSDGANLVLNPAASGGIFLNYDQGAGIYFGNGAGATSGTISNAGLATFSSLSVSGAKSFVIPHPLDETKELHHSCLEGPENGVYYRGEVETVEGLAQVVLPDYFEALTFQEDRSVQLTQIEDGLANFTMMRASRIQDGKFSIRTSEPSAKIAWLVMAVRKVGVERLQVAQDKA